MQHESRRLAAEAPIRELRKALRQSQTAFQRQILCDVLGKLHARSAIAELISCLDDEASSVRGAAADALAKIGVPRAGEPLLNRFESDETDPAVRSMLAAALGAVGYQAAVPALIAALASSDPNLRGSAAWSLGALQAQDALLALSQALQIETESYAKERMQIACSQISRAT